MDKITLVLNTDELKVVNGIWQLVTKQNLNTPELKLMYDITSKLAVKFKQKYIEKEFVDGNFKMKLTYAESYFLNKTLNYYAQGMDFEENPYKWNVILKQINFLTQKLV